MLSPKEMQDVLSNSNVMIKKYLCKFLNKKYNFNILNISVCTGKWVYIYLENYFAIRIVDDGSYGANLINCQKWYILYNSIIPSIPAIEVIKHNEYYKEEYLPIFMYFSTLENISNIYNYIDENYKFLYFTTYIQKLPLAYTFLLCNSITKQFPRDIAKLIVQKILFASDLHYGLRP